MCADAAFNGQGAAPVSGPMLDTVIGMIFVYLLMSLLCSAAQEVISSWLKLRSDNLKKGIDTLLADDNTTFFASQFHLHPLIDKLAPVGKSPSYIPASHFSAVMMDLIEQQSGKNPFKKLSGAINALPDGQMKQSLRVMSARSKGDADTFIGELEQWFDHGMDRASGWYKRKSQALITACFVSLGAPFWFNTLGKALNLLAAGNKPPKAKGKGS